MLYHVTGIVIDTYMYHVIAGVRNVRQSDQDSQQNTD